MATLAELMAEVMGEPAQTGHDKQASAKPTTDEIDQVLANLGLGDTESVKTASDQSDKTGGSMGLMEIYEKIMGEEAPVAQEEQTSEKTASEAAPAEQATEEASDSSTAFGELVGEYFNVMAEPFFDKVAGDLESEAGAGEQPLAHAGGSGSMGKAIAPQKDPHLPVNHSASGGHDLKVMTGGKSPYSLAVKQKLLKRLGDGIVGEQK